MGKEFVSEKEKKNRKRGLLIAFFFHTALIIFGLLPFLTQEAEEPKYESVVEINFAKFDTASKDAEKDAGAKKKKTAQKTEEKKVTQPKKVNKPTPKPKVQPKTRKPVVTSNDKKAPPVKTTKTPPKKTTPKPVDPTTESTDTEDSAEEAEDTASKGGGKSGGTSTNDGSGKGKSGQGKEEGTQGNGKGGEDFTGKAIFDRKVIYRPDIKKIVKKKGRIAINLCINREGRVVLVKYDRESSTIRDTDNIRKTLEATKKYKFERDYTVPKQQCGKMTFIIDK